MNEESYVDSVMLLKPGETFAKTRFIPQERVSHSEIVDTQRRLMNTLSSVLSRAKQHVVGEFRMYSFNNMTRDCGVIVSAVILREPEL